MTETEKTDNNICRLCLKVEDATFSPLDQQCYEKIKVVIPELIIDGTDFMICNRCNEAVKASYVLKQTLKDSNEFINAKKTELNIADKVILNQILNDDDAPKGKSSCRICLNSNEGTYTSIHEGAGDDALNNLLSTCIPELDRNLTADPVICEACLKALSAMNTLKTECLGIEDKIKQYCESDPETRNLNLNQVLVLLRDTEKYDVDNFLSEFEVRDEEGADIFDNIPNISQDQLNAENVGNAGNAQWISDYDKAKKRGLEGSNDRSNKRARAAVEPRTDDLPNFKFTLQLVHDMKAGVSLDEWMSAVEIEKAKHNWSDHVTIQKVLMRLKEMPDLYTWFSSIGDIMSWEEWRKKLLQAFPVKNDYYLCVKKMLKRRKRASETFAEYYKDKMEILETMDIKGEDAVSCLLGGLVAPNVLIGCIARIGNNKTPEELLTYFKSCDEKQKVMTGNNDKPRDGSPTKSFEKSHSPTKPVENDKTIEGNNKQQQENNNKERGNKAMPNSIRARERINRKRQKSRCYKCFQRGHTAAECRQSTPNTNQANTNRPNSNRANTNRANTKSPQKNVGISAQPKKKNPPKCNVCGKVGHRTRICPQIKLEKRRLLQQSQNQNNPSTYSARCSYCKKPNHTVYNCPQLKNKSPAQGHRSSSEQKCSFCNKLGHSAHDCRQAKNKISPARDNPSRRFRDKDSEPRCSYCNESGHIEQNCGRRERASQRPDKAVYKGPKCFYCGNFGHEPNTCRQAPRTVEESFYKENTYGAGSGGQGYRQLLCFKCYKIGHEVADCPRYPQRAYRD